MTVVTVDTVTVVVTVVVVGGSVAASGLLC